MDRGSAIVGPAHIDIFFPSHTQALNWGRRVLPVTVYTPRR
jgi:3D (Asp-Asp-Asp) domain-containing protein